MARPPGRRLAGSILAREKPCCSSARKTDCSSSCKAGDDRGRTRVDPTGSQTRVALQVRPEPVREMLFERVLPWLVKEAADA